MEEMGKAMMGTGEGEGETRAVDAAEKAIANPLLDDVSLQGARGVLINITGGYDLKLFEVDEAANRIKQEVDPEANIIVGSCFDDTMQGQMRVSVVATGIEAEGGRQAVEEAPEVAAPVRRAIPRPALNPESGELRPGARHAVRRAAIQRPVAASAPIAKPAASADIEDDFEIDEQSVTAASREVKTDAVATQQLATGTDGPGFSAKAQAAIASPAPTKPVTTVVDPNVAESAKSASSDAPAAPAKKSGFGGLNLIRKVANFGTKEEPKEDPYSEQRLDKDEEEDLKIPAFLRRQAN
jgi:cell division protein FtsZ